MPHSLNDPRRRAARMSDVGRRFAYRERARSPGEPVRPVEVVREGPPRSNKAKVRRLDGEYEGLEEWIPKVRLIAPWEEVEALLEDERRMFEALDASGDVYDTVPYKAILSTGGCGPLIMAAARKAGARLRVAFEAREQAAILAMVAEGLGVSIVPTLGLPSDTGNVVARPLEPRTPRTLALGHLPGVSPAARRSSTRLPTPAHRRPAFRVAGRRCRRKENIRRRARETANPANATR